MKGCDMHNIKIAAALSALGILCAESAVNGTAFSRNFTFTTGNVIGWPFGRDRGRARLTVGERRRQPTCAACASSRRVARQVARCLGFTTGKKPD